MLSAPLGETCEAVLTCTSADAKGWSAVASDFASSSCCTAAQSSSGSGMLLFELKRAACDAAALVLAMLLACLVR